MYRSLGRRCGIFGIFAFGGLNSAFLTLNLSAPNEHVGSGFWVSGLWYFVFIVFGEIPFFGEQWHCQWTVLFC